VPHGGTGVAALTPYAVLCGGTTGTAPVQPLAAVGTAGQLLTSNGAGALPSWQAAPAPLLPLNILHNGSAEVWQRGTIVSCSDNTYSADRWYALAERTGSVNVSVSQLPTSTAGRYEFDVKNTDPVAQRVGIAQVVESADATPYVNRPITFQVDLGVSASPPNLRIAVLQWTGTADAVTRDVVNDWTNASYTTANFFNSANLAVLAVSGSLAGVAGSSTYSITATPTSSCKNLIVFIWTEGTIAQNVHWQAWKIGLYDGAALRDWLPRPVAQELAICQRYLLALSTFPMGLAFNGTALYSGGVVSFPTTMRAAPSLVAGNAYAANTGNNGTPQLIGQAPAGTGMNNSGAAWTATAVINFTGLLSAEL
jgi:hypothetical protein